MDEKITNSLFQKKYLFQYIHDKASQIGGTKDIRIKTLYMAKMMDQNERGKLSVDQFAIFVKQNSSTRKTRRSRQTPKPPVQQQKTPPLPPVQQQKPPPLVVQQQQQQPIINFIPPNNWYGLPYDQRFFSIMQNIPNENKN